MVRIALVIAILSAGSAAAAGPAYTAASICKASDYTLGPFAPNSAMAVFGTGLARSTHVLAADDLVGGSLPVEMNFVRVYVQDQPVPLLFVSAGQVNFLMSSVQLPGVVRIRVVTEGVTGPEVTVTLVDAAPALFTLSEGYTIATNAAGKVLSADAPAKSGDIIVLYLTGLGITSPNPKPGEIPVAAAQMVSPSTVKITLGGKAVDPILIKYAGLTPGSAGLYQINLEVPAGTGTDPEIRVAAGDQSSGGLKVFVR
jgi:uncharacterized protein (TIGR03437 family)